jgi:hypothetical protein
MTRLRSFWPFLMIALIDVYAVWFVTAERTLYHADQVTYWSYSVNLAHGMVTRPLGALLAVARSVSEMDLNLLPAVPIAVMLAIFGSSRLAYVIAVISIYGLAAVVSSVWAVGALARRLGIERRELYPWAGLGAFVLLTTIWRPVFIGYLGLGGVAIGSAALGLYLAQPKDRTNARTLLLVGFLAALVVIFRRWYAFWSLAFGALVVIDSAWSFLDRRDWSGRALWRAVRTPLLVASSAAVTLLVLSPVITVQRLTTDYADRFSAYSVDQGLAQRLGTVTTEFGLGLIAVVICFTLTLLAREHTRRTAVLLVIQLAVTYLAMVTVQDHSPQHWYLYSSALITLIGLGLLQLSSDILNPRWLKAVLTGCLVVAVTTMAAIYLPAAAPSADILGPLVPGNRLAPEIRGDLAEVDRLMRFLDRRLESDPGFTYVLASSGTLSEQVLAFTGLSLGRSYRSTPTILQTAHVDRRDGFPRALLEARTVLVAEPIQVHLNPDDQLVVGVPAASFLKGENIGRAFRRLEPVFTLQGNVRVFAFARVRPIRAEEVDALSGLLAAAYPDRPEISRP